MPTYRSLHATKKLRCGFRVVTPATVETASSHETAVLLAVTGMKGFFHSGWRRLERPSGWNIPAAGTSQLGAMGCLAMTGTGVSRDLSGARLERPSGLNVQAAGKSQLGIIDFLGRIGLGVKSILTRARRIIVLVVIGMSAAVVMVLCGVVHPSGATSLSAHGGPSAHSGMVSSTDIYTVYLPTLARCCNGQTPPFGVQFYGALDSNNGFGEIAGAGASWVRVPISWRGIEPSDTRPEDYDWSGLDASVSNATEEGVELILTLGGQPSWVAVYAQGPVTDTEDIEEFFGAVVERYDGDGMNDAPGSPQVTYFELYNEPDNGDPAHAEHGGWGCWGDSDNDAPGCGDAEDYAELLRLLYPVVKEANAQAKLVFGGIALDWFAPEGPFDPHFLENVLAACEGQDCFDVMNFHYYPPFRPNWDAYGTAIIGKTSYVRDQLAWYGRADTPIICTETNWDSAASWGSDELQSRYVVKAYVRGMAANLDVVVWFWARDREAGGGPGLLDVNMQPKASYRAFEKMTATLRDAVYRRRLTVEETGDERIEGYVFETCGGRLDVVWNEDDTPYVSEDDPVLPLTVEAKTVRVVDKFGGEMTYRDAQDGSTDGQTTVWVGGSPIYLEYDQ